MSKKISDTQWLINVATFVFFVALFIDVSVWLISNKVPIYNSCKQLTSFIDANNEQLETAVTTLFDEAAQCSTEECKKNLRTQQLSLFTGSENVKFYPSSYLVRLNKDGNIEKWLWTGEVITTIPSTLGEKRVANLLADSGPPICVQGWKIDTDTTSMRYLKDFTSEAEIIQPIKKDGEIIGAMVMLYGD